MAGTFLDDVWMKVRVISGACSANVAIDDVQTYLQRGEDAARYGAMFIFTGGEKAANLDKAANALGKVRGTISTAKGLCLDAKAISQMHDAMKVLNDPENMKPGSEAAAVAFGLLFAGAGRFAAKLPPPASAYAQILEGCGDFFVNMQRLLDPEKRPGPQGRQMREVLKQIDSGL